MNKKDKTVINFRDRKLLFVDIEMTGLDPDTHEIIEIACLVVNGRTFEIEKEYYNKIKPRHPETGSEDGLRISGYNKTAWRKAKSVRTVLREVMKLAPGGMIAGWTTDKDIAFINKFCNLNKVKFTLDHHYIDVTSIAYYRLYKKEEWQEISLRKICKYLGIAIPEAHDAMTDITSTYKVFTLLMSND